MSGLRHLVLDLETVPDLQLYTPATEPEADRSFPPLFACQVVAVGALALDESLRCERITILAEGQSEAAMLSELADTINDHRPQVITWNGRGFDLPVLTLRALRHGISLVWYYQEPQYRDRYNEDRHLDLCDFLANQGAGRGTSLDGASRLIGLPGKGDMDGSQVEALYREGKLEPLYQYCLSDVAQTAFVFLRSRLLIGALDRDGYRQAAGDLLSSVQSDPRLVRLAATIDRPRLLLEG